MSTKAFSTPSANRITTQPGSLQHIIFRSSGTADTMGGTVRGTNGSGPANYEGFTLAGKVEVMTSGQFSDITQCSLAVVAAGTVTATLPGSSAIGDLRLDVLPADGHTLTIGLAGHAVTYRFKSTLAAINDIKIGASISATAISLNHAINGDGVAGTDYYTGTVAHPQFSGVIDGDVITLTDRIPCKRLLAWSMTQSNSDFSIRTPIGGTDGTQIFKFSPGVTIVANPLVFSTEDLSTVTLPAGMTNLVTTPILVGGKYCTVRARADSGVITFTIDVSTDGLNWTYFSTLGLEGGGEGKQSYMENIEYIRATITNSNSTDTKLDLRVIF